MATNFMVTSRMTTLRIFIEDDSLINNQWIIVDGLDELGSGSGNLSEILSMEYEHAEVYLAPHLSTIFKVNLDNISDRKINDELLLGLVEDNLVEDIEDCKPVLMKLSDGQSYIAVLSAEFYNHIIEQFQDYVKKIKFIQPIAYVTTYIEDKWTIYLVGNTRFVRTSLYEYYILDDAKPIPDVLDTMLTYYDADDVILYADDSNIAAELTGLYKINCIPGDDLSYGMLNWNFYNEKSKKLNLKLDDNTKSLLYRLLKVGSVFVSVSLLIWIVTFMYLIIEKYQLQKQITSDLSGVIRIDSYQSNVLAKVDDQLNALFHTKGLYAPNDFASLFDIFLRNTPDVNQHNIVGVKYSGSVLTVFLNSQFNNSDFNNVKDMLLTKRIQSTIIDYKTYSAQSSGNQNNNGGGVLDDASNGNMSQQQMTDAAWVISLQTVTKLDMLNEKNTKTKN